MMRCGGTEVWVCGYLHGYGVLLPDSTVSSKRTG